MVVSTRIGRAHFEVPRIASERSFPPAVDIDGL